MNYLAHLYLAERSGTSPVGNLLGDFIKGHPEGRFTSETVVGIRLHRRVDTVTDMHPAVRAARGLLPRPYRRYAGILLDVWFDHILARQWPRWYPMPLPEFARASAARISAAWPRAGAPFPADRLSDLPELLCSYRAPAGIVRALARIGTRLRHAPRLNAALPALQRQDAVLVQAFDTLLPELIGFTRREAPRLRAGQV